MMTALVRKEDGNLRIIRVDDYSTQKELNSDLRGNGYKVLKIWSGNKTDSEVDDWEYMKYVFEAISIEEGEKMEELKTMKPIEIYKYAYSWLMEMYFHEDDICRRVERETGKKDLIGKAKMDKMSPKMDELREIILKFENE